MNINIFRNWFLKLFPKDDLATVTFSVKEDGLVKFNIGGTDVKTMANLLFCIISNSMTLNMFNELPKIFDNKEDYQAFMTEFTKLKNEAIRQLKNQTRLDGKPMIMPSEVFNYQYGKPNGTLQ